MMTSVSTSSTSTTESIVKPIWQSKTFWLNFLTIMLAIISIIDPAIFRIDPKWLLLLTSILNILIRFLTDGPVSLTGNRSTVK